MLTRATGGDSRGERPEPLSSPSSANAPLVSAPEGSQNRRALMRGIKGVVRTTIGKTTAKTKKKRIRKPKTNDK